MSGYRFSVIVPMPQMSHDEILDATDAFGNAGCTDASIRGHTEGMELLFERNASSLDSAVSSAVSTQQTPTPPQGHLRLRASRLDGPEVADAAGLRQDATVDYQNQTEVRAAQNSACTIEKSSVS